MHETKSHFETAMKSILFSLLILTFINSLVSQTNRCCSVIDSNKVVNLAKKKKIYWTTNWQSPPNLKLDTSTCEWTMITGKFGYSNKGDCKYTNGCTVSTTATLVINAITGKTIAFEKKKKLFHNYE